MVRTGEWITKGWQLATRRETFWPLVLLTLIYWLAYCIATGTGVGILILYGPMTAAYYAVVLHLLKTGKVDFDRIGDGFRVFLQAMVAGLVSSLFITIGVFLCIIPGLILMTLYLFPLYLVVDRKMEFWQAMEASRLKVQEDLIGFLGFALVQLGIILLGIILFGIGLLVAIPIVACATAVAYRELWPESETKIISPEPPDSSESPDTPETST
jgi:uncharacterized membrane protein